MDVHCCHLLFYHFQLPWFMDLALQSPMQYCSYSIRPWVHHQSHPQLVVIFALTPSLHSFWSYFSGDLQYHIGHLAMWGVPLSVSYLFAFSYCSWGSQGKNTEVTCHSLSNEPQSVRPLHHDQFVLGCRTWHGLISVSWTRLWSMWSDWPVFCDRGFSLSAL